MKLDFEPMIPKQ